MFPRRRLASFTKAGFDGGDGAEMEAKRMSLLPVAIGGLVAREIEPAIEGRWNLRNSVQRFKLDMTTNHLELLFIYYYLIVVLLPNLLKKYYINQFKK